MTAPSLNEQLGSLSLPVALAPIEASRNLTSLDPGRRLLADLFKAAIVAELGAAWKAAIGATVLPDVGISTDTPVADVLEMEPSPPVMQQRQAKFPLLAVYRSGRGTDEQIALELTAIKQPWTVDWILGPADVARAFQVLDAGKAIWEIIRATVRRKGHPAYRSGAVVLGAGADGFYSVRVTGHEGPGQAKFAGDEKGTVYWAVTISLETAELTDGLDSDDGVELESVSASFATTPSADRPVIVRG